MKKFICLVITLLTFTLGVEAQDYVVRTSKDYAFLGAASDTINKDKSKTFTVKVNDYAAYVKFQITQLKVSGDYAKTKTYIEESLDNLLWVKKDSISLLGNGSAVGSWIAIQGPFIRFRSVGVDSVQTTKIKHTFLIEKKP
jgi:hypothetical protein